ncbi:MAG: hypothetical protein AB9Q19_09175 [Candidatus Reddybacter sp.]
MFPNELMGGLWHTTSLDRFNRILEFGAISPVPDIPDNERWCTRAGSANYPYIRHIGGVSLFDFAEFNPKIYSGKYPASSWSSFVPQCERFDQTVWIEINREQAEKNLITGVDLLSRWKNGGELSRNIMPLIECAYIGRLGVNLFVQAYLYESGANTFSKLEKP